MNRDECPWVIFNVASPNDRRSNCEVKRKPVCLLKTSIYFEHYKNGFTLKHEVLIANILEMVACKLPLQNQR